MEWIIRSYAMRGMATAVIRCVALAGLAIGLTVTGLSAQEWRTVGSIIYPEEELPPFERYDHVNPEAPKGGTLNRIAFGTFDSFNPFIVRGNPAAGLSYVWEPLMRQSLDIPGVSHGLIAEAFRYPDDYSSATYRLNRNARWHDGRPVTAEDVVWSFETLKKISINYQNYYANVSEAVALSDHEVEFKFNTTGNRELPHIIGDLMVLPKHWWEGQGPDGNKRDITRPTLEPPLGSGPYRIAEFRPGSTITYERVKDYWGEKVPVNVGRYNVDRIRFTYFIDDNAAFLAFKKGGIEDFRLESSTRRWTTEYDDLPAVKEGKLIKREFTDGGVSSLQAFVFNMRRPQFADRRVRKALTLAYNFEDQNRKHFFGLNKRLDSYFENSELAAKGLPEGRELEILEEFRDQLPPELFTEEFKLPVNDGPTSERQHLREALRLLNEAGWETRGGRLVNRETGQQFRIEFLGRSETDETITDGIIPNLRKLGIDVSLRIVDPAQYEQRVQNFDFDAITDRFPQSESPGNEQRDYWSSKAADTPGSNNTPGIKDPVVDALIDKIIFAGSRDELVAATRALDRVLLWNYYTLPQYRHATMRFVIWNKFGIPEKQPRYAGIDIDAWWILPEAMGK